MLATQITLSSKFLVKHVILYDGKLLKVQVLNHLVFGHIR